MMLQYLLLCVLATGAFASDDGDADRYMDNVLSNYLPEIMKRDHLQYPVLPPFDVMLHEDDKQPIAFHKGILFGLMQGLRRSGDCVPPKWFRANVTFGCYLGIDDLRAHYDVSSERDEDKRNFTADLLAENTKMWVLLTQRKPRPVFVKVHMHHLDLTVHLSHEPKLDKDKLKWFINAVDFSVEGRITDLLTGPFRTALEESVKTLPIPLPSLR
ncbi:uncharacterized protein LOC135399766 [Ornithodoros turicata]|uniref:uncharacterized protein LOC135399766 n=1 Tax=Ornithodoros turicata TaxID=34597 RepID=UPI003139AB3B